jgi:hypothetical protein
VARPNTTASMLPKTIRPDCSITDPSIDDLADHVCCGI